MVEFSRPARLDDQLVVETRVTRTTGARLGLRQDIKKDDQPLVSVDIELAFISPDMRPLRLPAALAAGFADMDSLPSDSA